MLETIRIVLFVLWLAVICLISRICLFIVLAIKPFALCNSINGISPIIVKILKGMVISYATIVMPMGHLKFEYHLQEKGRNFHNLSPGVGLWFASEGV